tara:strand:- start:851 stop:1135 length:285 start_codon:yes stop_codon:yes gene_type:complete
MTGIDYNVDLHQVSTKNPNHMIVEASTIGLPPGYFPNWISTNDIGNGSPFYADKIIREVTNASVENADEIEYGGVEAYLYRQNAGNLRLLVLND